jgi:autotransporter passenger strand-loop-strand repeat protein
MTVISGVEWVSGGEAIGTIIGSGGQEVLWAWNTLVGGVDIGAVVSGGSLHVGLDCVASNTTVCAGGVEYVDAGGTTSR